MAAKLITSAIVITTLVFGLVQWRAGAREAAAEINYPATGEIVDVDGVPVHVQMTGTGPDLVLIHGASGNLREFTFDLMKRLTDHYRVIAFDRPGLGWTGRLPGNAGAWNPKNETPQAQAAVLQKAADKLGVANPIVLGHSYGGAVALAWALGRPDTTSAVVLVAAVSEPWPGTLGLLYGVTGSAAGGALVIPPVTAFLPKSIVNSSIESIFAPQTAPQGYAEHLGPGLTLRRESMRANAQQVNGLLPHIIEMKNHYDTLRMPIELVHGDSDTIVPASIHAEVFAAEVSSARLTLLPGMGHMPHHGDPQAIVDAIERAAIRAGLR
ncbi:MAG: alpha/beta hydrolase [Sulfitobacter sp.]